MKLKLKVKATIHRKNIICLALCCIKCRTNEKQELVYLDSSFRADDITRTSR